MGRLEQAFPEIRMGYLNQLLYTLLNGAATQSGDSLFGNKVMHIRPVATDACTHWQVCNNSGENFPVFIQSRTGKGNNRAAPPAHCRATDKVHH